MSISSKFFHIAITMSGSEYPVLGLDLSKNDLDNAVMHLKEKTKFAVAGVQILPHSVTRIQVIESDIEAALSFIEVDQDPVEVREFKFEPSPHQYTTLRGIDVTEQYEYVVESTRESEPVEPKREGVFLIHGRDLAIRNSMSALLDLLKAKPFTFEDALKLTGKASPYVFETVEAGIKAAGAVMVLITPDDVGRLRDQSEESTSEGLSGQARQNVILEAGMALAYKGQERTIIIEFGKTRVLSDLTGLKVIRFHEDSREVRQEILQALERSGVDCAVDKSNDFWMSVIKFPISKSGLGDETSESPQREGSKENSLVVMKLKDLLEEFGNRASTEDYHVRIYNDTISSVSIDQEKLKGLVIGDSFTIAHYNYRATGRGMEKNYTGQIIPGDKFRIRIKEAIAVIGEGD